MKKALFFAIVAVCAIFARAENPPWAKCVCPEPSPVPDGTYWADGELCFTNRTAGGAAKFDFAVLDADVFADATIVFADGVITVDSLTFDPMCGFTFAGSSGTILKGIADKSIFDGSGTVTAPVREGADGTVVWSNLTFTCDAAVRPVWRNGGAITISGGGFTITDCVFTECFAEEFGGAVFAPLLSLDSMITNCAFRGSWVSAYNGYGGAVYVSASEEGKTLSVVGSEFSGNEAVNGGAICTVRAADDLEIPIALEISSCRFEDNVADYDGGAIFAESAVTVKDDGRTDFVGNAAGLDGGAICLSGIAGVSEPAEVSVGAGTSFVGNFVANDVDDGRWWTCGGAISLLIPGSSLSVYGRHAIFDGNYADSQSSAFGGAIYAASGTVVNISCAAFLANRADTAGGALFACGDSSSISVCIFSNNTVTSSVGYGGAVSVESGCELSISNSTIRGSDRNAVDAYCSKAELVNCVVADNGGADVFVGGDAELVADHTAYGRMEVSEGIPISTNACLSGVGAQTYLGTTLYLDSLTRYNPVAALGLVQAATDFDDVPYGSRPEGYSMGAYECKALKANPEFEIVSSTWYHDRSVGLYYPRLEIRFLDGDNSRLVGFTVTCGGVDHELPAECVSRLKTAAPGEVLSFGVDPDSFVQYHASPANWGFVPPESRLFGMYDASRPLSLSVSVTVTPRVAEVVTVPRKTVARTQLAKSVPVSARFTDFKIGERLSGHLDALAGAKVLLYGCETLGADWRLVGELEVDGDGAFTIAIPDGLRFFRLEAEVTR